MPIICKIDNRERDLIQSFINNNIKIETQNLDIGDIQIIYIDDSYVEHNLVVIERKTYDDLGASIKDGRYKEQKMRLLANNNNIIQFLLLLLLFRYQIHFVRSQDQD